MYFILWIIIQYYDFLVEQIVPVLVIGYSLVGLYVFLAYLYPATTLITAGQVSLRFLEVCLSHCIIIALIAALVSP